MAARALTRAARNHRSVGIVAPPRTATAMMLMAAAYGADIRLVAFMQYLIPMAVETDAPVTVRPSWPCCPLILQ